MAHIFEAKTMPGFEAALPYAVKQMAYWCKMTGCADDPNCPRRHACY